MRHYTYDTKQTCSKKIEYDISSDGTIHNISFTGGCNGNLKAISKLCEGMKANELIEKLSGIICGQKPTSCADQLVESLQVNL